MFFHQVIRPGSLASRFSLSGEAVSVGVLRSVSLDFPLPDRGGAFFLLGLDEQRDGFDQGQVGERLREVPEMLA